MADKSGPFQLHYLPIEIWLVVVSFDLDAADFHSLSLVCKRFNEFAQPCLFANVTIELGHALLDNLKGFIWMSHSDPSVSTTANMLERIRFILSPRIAPFVRKLEMCFTRKIVRETPQIPAGMEAGHRSLDVIVTSLPRMSSLRELTFVTCPISDHHLRILRHLPLAQIFVTFTQCTPLYSASEQRQISLRTVAIKGYFNHGICHHALLLSTVWTQSLAELTIRSLQKSSIIVERELNSRDALTMLSTLNLDETSFEALYPYFHLFPNLHRFALSCWGPLSSLPPSFPAKVNTLKCPIGYLYLFSGLPIRELTLSAFVGWRHGQSPDKMEATIRSINHLLTELFVLELFNYLDDCILMRALLVHCQKLRHLKLIIDFPEELYFFDPSLQDVLADLFLHLRQTTLSPTLDNLQIFLDRYLILETIYQGQHIFEDMIVAHLNTLDMMHFPPLLRTITFSSQSVRKHFNDHYVFLYVTHEKGTTVEQWRKLKRYQSGYDKWQLRQYKDDDSDED